MFMFVISISFPNELGQKPFISQAKQIKRNLDTWFCRQKTAEDDNAKNKRFPEYTLYISLNIRSDFSIGNMNDNLNLKRDKKTENR